MAATELTADAAVADADVAEVSDDWNELHLPARLLKAVNAFGFAKPTDIQRGVIPVAIGSRRDIVGAAETGSGKTLAFLLPVVHHLLRDLSRKELKQKSASTLILAPTRELARQVYDTLMLLLEHLQAGNKKNSKENLRACLIIGGLSREKQQRLLGLNPHIIVGTPGRIWDQFQAGEACLQRLHRLKYLVIDEADRMVEKGHFPELNEILELINGNAEVTAKRQNYVFSATLMTIPPRPKRLKKLDKNKIEEMSVAAKLDSLMQLIGFKANPKIVDLTRQLLIARNVHEERVLCTNDNKDHMLYYLLTTEACQRTLVFCNSIDGVRRLRGVLSHLFPDSTSQTNKKAASRSLVILHSKMHQRQRMKYFERFSEQSGAIFLCTDIAARGLDFPQVEHVIHYQVPRTFELYVHRSGRTARGGDVQGKALLMVAPNEAPLLLNVMSNMKRAETDLPVHEVDRHIYERLAERVDLARFIDLREHRRRRDKSDKLWFKRTADSADLDDNVEEQQQQKKSKNSVDDDELNVADAADRKMLTSLKNRLHAMLSQEWKPSALLTVKSMKFPSSFMSGKQYEQSSVAAAFGEKDAETNREVAEEQHAHNKQRTGEVPKKPATSANASGGRSKRQRNETGEIDAVAKNNSHAAAPPVKMLGVKLMTSKGPVYV